MAATGMKKILFQAKVIESSNRENTYNIIARTQALASFLSWGCSWPSKAMPAPTSQPEHCAQCSREGIHFLAFLSILDA